MPVLSGVQIPHARCDNNDVLFFAVTEVLFICANIKLGYIHMFMLVGDTLRKNITYR